MFAYSECQKNVMRRINSISVGLWLAYLYENEVTLKNIDIERVWRQDAIFSSLLRFLTFCKSNFFLFLNFLIFVSLPLSLPPSHTRNNEKKN